MYELSSDDFGLEIFVLLLSTCTDAVHVAGINSTKGSSIQTWFVLKTSCATKIHCWMTRGIKTITITTFNSRQGSWALVIYYIHVHVSVYLCNLKKRSSNVYVHVSKVAREKQIKVVLLCRGYFFTNLLKIQQSSTL